MCIGNADTFHLKAYGKISVHYRSYEARLIYFDQNRSSHHSDSSKSAKAVQEFVKAYLRLLKNLA